MPSGEPCFVFTLFYVICVFDAVLTKFLRGQRLEKLTGISRHKDALISVFPVDDD